MTRLVTVRPAAEVDIQETHNYLEEVRPGIGGEFLTRLQEVFERIESNPEEFAPIWHDVRAVRVRKFQYVVYFVLFSDRVEILAVMHGSRRASRWQSRA
jgi:toxin ParE1/3/4